MGQQIEQLARFVAETRCADIPELVRRHAKLVLLDTLGVILAGGERPEVRQLRERLTAFGRRRAPRSTRAAGRAKTRAPRHC